MIVSTVAKVTECRIQHAKVTGTTLTTPAFTHSVVARCISQKTSSLSYAGMAFALTYHVAARVGEYFLRDTVTSISEQFELSMPFPAVTMCSFNR